VYDGDLENGSLMAGQISGMIDKIETVAEIINKMVYEASCLLPEGRL
jgi:enoyl-[acyl-carrier protein] reductase II